MALFDVDDAAAEVADRGPGLGAGRRPSRRGRGWSAGWRCAGLPGLRGVGAGGGGADERAAGQRGSDGCRGGEGSAESHGSASCGCLRPAGSAGVTRVTLPHNRRKTDNRPRPPPREGGARGGGGRAWRAGGRPSLRGRMGEDTAAPRGARPEAAATPPAAARSARSGGAAVDAPARSQASTPAAAARPSAIAHTISDWPRPASPATNTPGTEVMKVVVAGDVAARVELDARAARPARPAAGRGSPSRAAPGRPGSPARCPAPARTGRRRR